MANTEQATADAQLAAYWARWQQRHAGEVAAEQDIAAAYHFASDLAHTTGIQYGRSWADIAPEFQRQWLLHGSGLSWASASDLMREVWEDASNGGRRILEGDRQAPEHHARA
jgi:hypothetical protein